MSMLHLKKQIIFVSLIVLIFFWIYFYDDIIYTYSVILDVMKSSPMEYFHPTMTERQKADMLKLLSVFKGQMEKFNIIYFLYGGSLIGAYRHHGMIPWDDDVDILVDSKKKEMLKAALNQLNKTHSLKDYAGNNTTKWKFYKLDGRPYSHKPFRYPYLDLFFFNEYNATAFYVEVENSFMSKKEVFPLVDKMFDGIPLPTPCNTIGILNSMYSDLNKCLSPSWNHSTEYGISRHRQAEIDCDLLKSNYSFTERNIKNMSDGFYVTETLKKGNSTVQKVTYVLPLACSTSHYYYNSKVFVEKL